MNPHPVQSIDETVAAFLSDFERITDTADEVMELEYLRSKWRRMDEWATRAEQFLAEANGAAARGTATHAAMERLRDAAFEIRTELILTPEGLIKAAQQAARGEVIPISEIRAELEQRRRQSRSITGEARSLHGDAG